MNLQENIRKVLREESLKQSLMDEIKRFGIRDTASIMGVSVEELLDMVGIRGTKDNMIFLAKAIMDNDVKQKLNTSQTRVNNSCQQFIKPKLLIMRGCVCDWSCGFHGVAVRLPRPYGSALPPYLNKRVCVSGFLFLVGVCA